MNELRFFRKHKLFFVPLILLSLNIFSSAVSSGASHSTLQVGVNGYVKENQDTIILIHALDSTDTDVSGASATVSILTTGVDSSGSISGGGFTNQNASNPTAYSPTNSSGYLELTWSVPATSVEATAEVIVSIFDGSVSYEIPHKIVTITPNVLSLDVTDVNSPESIYSGFNTSLTVSAQNFLGGVYTSVSVTVLPNSGTYSITSGNLDVNGLFTTVWTAPELSSPQNVSIQISLQTVSNQNYDLSKNVLVIPVNLGSSTISTNSSSIGAEDEISIQILSKGSLGTVPNTNGTISQLNGDISGQFSASNFVTNASGYADLTWRAPRVTSERTFTLQAILNYAGVSQNLEVNITVSPYVYDVVVSLNVTTVDPEDTVEVIVQVKDNGQGVSDATVLFSSSDGTFNQASPLTTNSSGYVVMIWSADFVPVNVIGSNVELSFSAFDNTTGTSEVVKSVHVNPYPLVFPSAYILPKTEFTIKENISMSVVVLNSTNNPFEGALVTITALAGSFESTNETSASNTTDADGFADFTWRPTGLKDPNQNQILTFDYEVSISEYNYIASGNFSVTIVPSNSNTSSQSGTSQASNTGSGNNVDSTTYVIGGIVGVVGVAAIIALIRRRG